MTRRFDVVVVGGGIVGIATAWQLTRMRPGITIAVLEAADRLAAHQTGNNSGVIHSGLYYRPGSYKAQNCVAGRAMLYDYCERKGIPVDRCGKIVVAVDESEVPRLDALFQRGLDNGLIGLRKLSGNEIVEYEPAVRGIKAIHVPETGIVNYIAVTESLARDIANAGGRIQLNTSFLRLVRRNGCIYLETTQGEIEAGQLVNCGGLQSDRIARLCGVYPDLMIIPFRGEYYTLKPESNGLVRNLIYPVPDPQFPFLGVHFTRMIDGSREAGPNAVLSFKREGYKRTDFSLNDVMNYLSCRSFWTMSMRHWRMGMGEFYRSFFKYAFVRALQRLVPEIRQDDVVPGGAGVRAQALEHDGFLVDDFRIVRTADMVHVLNAPSPAATACLSIGRTIGGIVLGS
ncbi:L-2-hydroxyglutarate oxidase [bacterium]|nr:L-2-hydroxyglutarate oxidase [candidate division CSSED10-310 bacterium]